MRNLTLSICVACLALTISACANLKAVNKPLPRWTPEKGHLVAKQIAGDRSPEMLVLVAFSGGGTRAAAFSYGVLKELAETEVKTEKGPRPLLNEIDIISSVSGGSFTSAYYGLRGNRIFDEFEDRFLRKNVQGGLFWQVFRPINWFRLFSSTYGNSDIAADYYDKHIFNNATFADIQRPDAPLLIINATDLASSLRFPFTQSSFDLICSDINQYPISRAVASSSAVPVLLSPITFKSYAGSCGYELPASFHEAMKTNANTSK